MQILALVRIYGVLLIAIHQKPVWVVTAMVVTLQVPVGTTKLKAVL
jgi:hypothetical protein